MKMPKSLIIDPQFKNLIPPLQRTEYLQLEENLLADGCRDPLVVWRGTLVDGHNRYEICMRHRIPFSVTEVDFYCREEAIAWICANQLGRRNLSEGTRKYLIGKQYDSEKFVSKIKNPSGLNQYSLPVSPRPDKQDSPDTSRHRTADRIADENCISAGTVEKYAVFSRAVDKIADAEPALGSKILSGQYKVSHKNIVALSKLEPAEMRKVDRKIRRMQQQPFVQFKKTRTAINRTLEQPLSSYFGFQPRTVFAFSDDATSCAGSPARRAAISHLIGLPTTFSAVSMISLTVKPTPLPRLNTLFSPPFIRYSAAKMCADARSVTWM